MLTPCSPPALWIVYSHIAVVTLFIGSICRRDWGALCHIRVNTSLCSSESASRTALIHNIVRSPLTMTYLSLYSLTLRLCIFRLRLEYCVHDRMILLTKKAPSQNGQQSAKRHANAKTESKSKVQSCICKARLACDYITTRLNCRSIACESGPTHVARAINLTQLFQRKGRCSLNLACNCC